MTKKEKETHDALVTNLLELRIENAHIRHELAYGNEKNTRIGCNLAAVLMKIGFPEVVTLNEADLNGVAIRFVAGQYVPRVEDIDIPKLQKVLEELKNGKPETKPVEPKPPESKVNGESGAGTGKKAREAAGDKGKSEASGSPTSGIKEGSKSKGGVNSPPTTQRPSPPVGQGKETRV